MFGVVVSTNSLCVAMMEEMISAILFFFLDLLSIIELLNFARIIFRTYLSEFFILDNYTVE